MVEYRTPPTLPSRNLSHSASAFVYENQQHRVSKEKNNPIASQWETDIPKSKIIVHCFNDLFLCLCCIVEDKRKSVADFRDSSALYGREKFPISVKAISELYLSKVAAAEPTGNLLKPVCTCVCSFAPFAWTRGQGMGWPRTEAEAAWFLCRKQKKIIVTKQ